MNTTGTHVSCNSGMILICENEIKSIAIVGVRDSLKGASDRVKHVLSLLALFSHKKEFGKCPI